MKKYRGFIYISRKLVGFILFISLPLFAKEGWLGVYVDELTNPMKIAMDVEYGLLVEEVIEDSPAEKAGIKVGDILLKIDDVELEEFDDLSDYVEDNGGKEVKIKIKRKQEIKDISVKLGERRKSEKEWFVEIPEFRKWRWNYFFYPPKETRKIEKKLEELEKNLRKLFDKLEEKYEELPETKPKGKIKIKVGEGAETI